MKAIVHQHKIIHIVFIIILIVLGGKVHFRLTINGRTVFPDLFYIAIREIGKAQRAIDNKTDISFLAVPFYFFELLAVVTKKRVAVGYACVIDKPDQRDLAAIVILVTQGIMVDNDIISQLTDAFPVINNIIVSVPGCKGNTGHQTVRPVIEVIIR